MRVRSVLPLAALAGLLAVPSATTAQETAPPTLYNDSAGTWVYASYFQVPWPKVDSLIKLNRFLPAYRERGVEMGCFLDVQLLIHQTGNEYNVVTSTTFDSFRKIGPGSGSGTCTNRAWREVVPDAALRAAISEGRNWVFGDAVHYDIIYWIPYPKQQ